MKEKILEISKKLESNEITEQEAKKQFLFLFDVSKRSSDTELKPSGIGVIVDKSKATKTFPMRGTTFRKGCSYNWPPDDRE